MHAVELALLIASGVLAVIGIAFVLQMPRPRGAVGAAAAVTALAVILADVAVLIKVW